VTRDKSDSDRQPVAEYRSIRLVREGPVLTVVMARPERRNAVDGVMSDELAAAFEAFEGDDDASVAVLYGEGGSFCAGADLKAIGTKRANRVKTSGHAPLGPTRMSLSKPVIAAVEGYAVAGGLELAIWCDLRVVSEDAVFGVFCRRWGVPLIDGGTVRLPRLIGTSRATDMILTGRPVDAAEAAQIGLANRVVPSGTTLQAAQDLARQLSGFPQTCLRNDLRSVHYQHGHSEADAMAFELTLGRQSLAAGAQQGASLFTSGAGRHGSFDASSPQCQSSQ
jgi:enoyl-CoA hydratase